MARNELAQPALIRPLESSARRCLAVGGGPAAEPVAALQKGPQQDVGDLRVVGHQAPEPLVRDPVNPAGHRDPGG